MKAIVKGTNGIGRVEVTARKPKPPTLKPCPWCARAVTLWESDGLFRVGCAYDRGCKMSPVTGWYLTADDAVNVWNKRAKT